ncbi:alpha/beta hydrolase family protein [Corynebacterium tuberculostearicum]|uniref:alpha/beta hydrolase n=1 Tax=Corynebacterium tuberculostearicum TaxID=38304 RepID=UPI0029352ACE|nr:alpha/beta hydrolase family protein [Corynebacterium tuberculostearicum]MDV2429113.1 alpha/beta hydrolase family protein [Corynebacterium tuberculostearicum]
MHTLRSIGSSVAGIAIAAGVLSAPLASAVEPAEIQGDATPSTIREVNLTDSADAENINYAITTEGENRVVDIAKLKDKDKWKGYAFGHKSKAGKHYGNHVKTLTATSAAMDGREVPLAVITPDGNFDKKRPTLYLLNGAGGAEQGMDWLTATANHDIDPETEGVQDMVDFYTSKDVNVVIPQAGAFSYYTDWVSSPNSGYLKGPQKWETFLAKELPGALEEHIGGNGKRAIAGMSMSATSSLLLAEHNPGFYNAVGSFSGCASTSRPLPRLYTQLTVNRGGGSADQMWGAMGSEYNVYNDALVNANPNNLGKSETYVSVNSGLGGANDWGVPGSSTLIVEGGVIEAAMNSCTHDLKAKMDSQGMKADWNFRNTGTHSWPGWRNDLFTSWATFERGFAKDAAEAPAKPEVKPNELSIEAPQAEEDAQVKDAPSAADQSPDKDFVEGKDAEGAEAPDAAEAAAAAEAAVAAE